MKKNLKTLFLALVLCVGVFGLTGCKEKKNTIVGKWAYNKSYIYTFKEDNTCSYDAGGTVMECTYKIDGDKISILYKGSTAAFETTYSIDGNKLNIKDSFGNDTIYTRK